MKNAFGDIIPELNEIVKDPETRNCIGILLGNVLDCLGIRNKNIINNVLVFAEKYKTLSKYESNMHDIFVKEGVVEKIPERLNNRAEMVFEQIKNSASGKIVDIGCGDGKVGEMLSKKYSVELCDVYKHSHIGKTGLKFKMIKENKPMPFNDNSFDTALLLTVLHHSSNPLHTLKEAIRVTRRVGRIIVIESVYGINGARVSENKQMHKAYFALSKEKQRLVNVFIDHFYNRCIHYSKNKEQKVSVPFNFRTPEQWKEFFEANGLKVENAIHLGIDRPLVPEYHMLFVLRK